MCVTNLLMLATPHGAYGDLHWMVFHLSAPKVHIKVEWINKKPHYLAGLELIFLINSIIQ